MKSVLRINRWEYKTPFKERQKWQGSQIRQNCSDDSTEVTEGVTLTPKIFGNKHSFVLTFFATNTIYVNCKRCKP